MKNLQLIDSFDGGYFVFKRNDYILDEGIYSELYCAFFATKSPEWLGDTAFDSIAPKVASRTENALVTYNSNSTANINLIKKAIKDDSDRFMQKNPNIIISAVGVKVYRNSALEILIEIDGNDEAYNFIWQKTKESLDNIESKVY